MTTNKFEKYIIIIEKKHRFDLKHWNQRGTN
jgi:hypothetical protein